MKHINNYKQFNEGLFDKEKYDLFKRNKYDVIVKKIFTRIKDTFNDKDLKHRYFNGYEYRLEESIATNGYINICIERLGDKNNGYVYYLKIDDKVIKCSNYLKSKIFNFFSNIVEKERIKRDKERQKREKVEKIDIEKRERAEEKEKEKREEEEFRNKYKDIY